MQNHFVSAKVSTWAFIPDSHFCSFSFLWMVVVKFEDIYQIKK